jgi:hypothetical protein
LSGDPENHKRIPAINDFLNVCEIVGSEVRNLINIGWKGSGLSRHFLDGQVSHGIVQLMQANTD